MLLLRRAERSGDTRSGAWVFPGGVLDPADPTMHRLCESADDAAWSARLALPSGGLDYAVAALRECFEEVGLLLAHGTQEALADLRQVIRTLAEGGLTDDERDIAVQNLVGVAPLRYETAAAVAGTLTDQVEQQLPDDFQGRLYARLAATGTVEATAAAVRAFPLERLVVVLVGDASVIAEPVRALGFGPVRITG